MKNYIPKLILIGLVASVFSCSEPSVEQEPVIQNGDFEQESGPNLRYGGHKFCVFYIEPGRRIFLPGGGRICSPIYPGICSIKIIDCFVWFDPCLFPCGIEIIDPWEIYKWIDPRELVSVKDKLDIKIDPAESLIPFPVNENVLGLQFYGEIKEVLNKETLVLEDDLVLDPEFAKENGLKGNVIPAGKYPVIVNPENETFNAFVSVKADKAR